MCLRWCSHASSAVTQNCTRRHIVKSTIPYAVKQNVQVAHSVAVLRKHHHFKPSRNCIIHPTNLVCKTLILLLVVRAQRIPPLPQYLTNSSVVLMWILLMNSRSMPFTKNHECIHRTPDMLFSQTLNISLKKRSKLFSPRQRPEAGTSASNYTRVNANIARCKFHH